METNKQGGYKMNAQDFIDNCGEPTDFLRLFYPTIADQKLVDANITKILKELK